MNIKATFPVGTHKITVHGLTQWDRGRTLTISASDLPGSCEVHLACMGQSEALICECTGTGSGITVGIPEHCLEQSQPITVWVYATAALHGVTTHTIILPIEPRPKPSTIHTPDDTIDVVLQEKTATPNILAQEVIPDAGYDGLSKVIVEAIPNNFIQPTGTKDITANGNNIDVKRFAAVNVNVPNTVPEGYIKPHGEITIYENGSYDVSEYEKVQVTIPEYEGEVYIQSNEAGSV